MSSDIEHWHINAIVHKDCVEETHYVSDPARNIRRRPETTIWQVERLLGRGGFGEVRLERNKRDGRARAVKRIAMMGTNLTNMECEKELKALLEFSKPKSREAAVFVDFFGWFKDGSDVFIAMEYVPLGDLERNITAHSGKIPENEARSIIEQILSGLEIMHGQLFAHRDLKPQNVLVIHGPPMWWVKLADFGLSKKLTDSTAYHTKAGTQSYMAPEMLYSPDGSSDYTDAIDIWAVGCIAYRLVSGCVPFTIPALVQYCQDKSLFPLDPLFDCSIKSEGSKFLRHLLVTEPKDRPSASQALQHEWILSSTIVGISNETTLQSQELPEITQLTVSSNDYNTVSHAGLKSYQSAIEMSKTLKPKHFHGITPGGAAFLPAEEETTDNILQHSRVTSPGLTSPIRNDEATNYLNSNFGPAGVVDSADDSLRNSSKSPVLEEDESYGHLPNRTAQNFKEQEHTTGRGRNPAERDERRDSRLSDVLKRTVIVQGTSAEPPTARVGRAGVPPPENKPPKGILRPPREKFPEDPRPIREGVAPSKEAKKDGIPPDARWTKISRKLVNPEALEAGKERFEARDDFVIVLRVLSGEEVQGYAADTQRIRAAREELEELEARERSSGAERYSKNHEIEEQEARKPSSGAAHYRKTFQSPFAIAYEAAQEGLQARTATYEAWENLRHGKTREPPQPLPRGTPISGREESNARLQRPIPLRPESSSQYQRSYSSSIANRKGFMPNVPGGDEPSAPRGSYSTQRDKPGVALDLPGFDYDLDPPGFDYDPPSSDYHVTVSSVYNAGKNTLR